MPKTLKSALV